MGSVTPQDQDRPPYPIGVPTKFTPDGTAVRYPGNTTVCHIAADSPLMPALQLVYDTLASHPRLSEIFRLLPPESWHMTVFDGVREIECEPGMWPAGKGKLPVDECTALFAPKLRALGQQLAAEGLAPPYRMRARGFLPVEPAGLGFAIEGATPQEESRMRQLRDRLADTLGFRAPNHYVYPFHVSVAYLLRWAEGEDRDQMFRVLDELAAQTDGLEFELGPVEFNTFETMLAYPRLFYLGESE
ncbi:RNA ligase/cyclic nucleotide phosphodiesterase [Microdochium bolleyi]|uniref:RNA ligase/cyclic nucleotide phosphodiesterase n=1 Tax=Microdochium bolleyi TaxID=196109 RepID=A0A136ILF8_9PEZI|nr:RNA ligase/cyclic nucleotide phosphodiesterase [Microdochium bolleyi]